jgi:hypothetical protein
MFVPDTREIGIFSPMLECSGDGLALLAALGGFEKAGPGFELGFEPGAGLVAELGAIGIGERLFRPPACFLSVRRTSPRSRSQRRGAGGVVAMLRLAILGELSISNERFAKEPRRASSRKPD